MMHLGKLIQKLLKIIGYKVVKIDNLKLTSSLKVLDDILDKDSEILIFDIGAHKGQSAKMYRRIFKKAEIFSFEPSPELYEILISLNIPKFKAYNFGFSNKKSNEEFSINFKSATNSLLPLSKNAKKVWALDTLQKKKTIVCNFDTLDNFCDQKNVKFIDFMKIDVQGAEYLVLEGSKKMLLNKKINLIQLEVIIGDTYLGQKSIGFYISLLESYGYKLIMFTDFVIRKGVLIQTDLFFKS